MAIANPPEPGRFFWLDLAATDASRARRFYAEAFGWTAHEQDALGGHFTLFQCGGRNAGTLYPLDPVQLARGVPSHWTPYLAVEALEPALRRVVSAGGRVVVPPLLIPKWARIALVEDAVGALLGLWQSLPAEPIADQRGAASAG